MLSSQRLQCFTREYSWYRLAAWVWVPQTTCSWNLHMLVSYQLPCFRCSLRAFKSHNSFLLNSCHSYHSSWRCRISLSSFWIYAGNQVTNRFSPEKKTWCPADLTFIRVWEHGDAMGCQGSNGSGASPPFLDSVPNRIVGAKACPHLSTISHHNPYNCSFLLV